MQLLPPPSWRPGCRNMGRRDGSLDRSGRRIGEVGWLNREVSCDDEAYWAEREASTSMSGVAVPYLRIQTEHDHVQPDNAHAVVLVNAATEGLSPWTRLNDEAPNITYDPEAPPAMLPDSIDRELMVLVTDRALELVALHG